MPTTIKAGIAGASGYTGETLVRLVAGHPRLELAAATSRKFGGIAIEEALPRLRGAAGSLAFTDSDADELAQSDLDVVFLSLPHGVSVEYAPALVEAGKLVIDLSADFRLDSPKTYEEYYGKAHPAPEWLAKAAYVIPELAADAGWRQSRLIACPGCYPTCVQLALAPLLKDGALGGDRIVINAVSGISGAGKKATEFYSYCERADSVVAYGAPKHRHLSEMEERLSAIVGKPITLQFTPHLVPQKRGMCATIVAPDNGSKLTDLYASWEARFGGSPFVRILPSGAFPDTALVAGTNRADLSAVHDERTGNFVIFSAIDNLLKGAGGQAVQALNLIQGWPETEGLIL